MSSANHRTIVNSPVAMRSPAPDVVMNNQLTTTKSLEIKPFDRNHERIPLIKEIAFLTRENIRLKGILNNNAPDSYRRELDLKDKQIKQLKDQLNGNMSNTKRKLFVTVSNSERKSIRNSTERKNYFSELDSGSSPQIEQLKNRILQLEKQNIVLKRQKSETVPYQSANIQITKKEIQGFFNAFMKNLQTVQENSNIRIKELEFRIEDFQRRIANQRANNDSLRSTRKISIITSTKKNKGNDSNSKYNTPYKVEPFNSDDTTYSKRKINELERQNQYLVEQNTNIKRNYEDLIRKFDSSQSSSPEKKDNGSLKRSVQIQGKLNQLLLDNQSLRYTLQDLRNNIELLEQQNYELKLKLSTFGERLEPTIHRVSEEEESIVIQNLERSNSQLQRQKELIQSQFYIVNQNYQRLQQSVNVIKEQNQQLKRQNLQLTTDFNKRSLTIQKQFSFDPKVNKGNSKLQQIWNQLVEAKKTIGELRLKNIKLQKELEMRPKITHDTQKYSLIEQNENLKTQLEYLRNKLIDVEQILSNMPRGNNQEEIKQISDKLIQIHTVLGRIAFTSLEITLKEMGDKYNHLFEEKRKISNKLKQSTYDLSKLTFENDNLNKSVLQFKGKFINERSQRQELQIKLSEQLQKVRVLNEQIVELNHILNEYTHKQSPSTYQSRPLQLDTEVANNISMKGINQLKQIETQVRTISISLSDLIGSHSDKKKRNNGKISL